MRAKGIIAKPMPSYWYSYRNAKELIENGGDELNMRILAEHKPYFMIYIYSQLRKEYRRYIKNSEDVLQTHFSKYGIHNVEQLRILEEKTDDMKSFLEYFDNRLCVGDNPCVVNRVSHIFEKNFSSLKTIAKSDEIFDYSILKSNVPYSKSDYKKILDLYDVYKSEIDSHLISKCIHDVDERKVALNGLKARYIEDCSKVCPNKYELCDIILDICYQRNATKRFAWDVVGAVIIENLLRKNDFNVSYPKANGNEFVFNGVNYSMATIQLEDNTDDYFE